MSQTVDNRVVELEFDNKQFEQGTKESLTTIQKLKDALKFEDAGKNLQDLGKVTKNFDLNSIGNAVEQVGEKFSTMRLVGLMALSNIVDGAMQAGKKILSAFTAPLQQIKTGGWNRAMNIEDAKFQLKGLGVAWEEVADDIDYAVSGTAYGLDAAAKAASQLTASGVQAGDAMKKSLRGISGVAAMANTSYEEISPIFTTIAGQGKVMTMQLRQLESRGINAAATLRDEFNKVADGTSTSSERFQKYVQSITKGAQVNEEAIRDMVTKGKIDFQTFSEAMDNAFGEHAKEANDTFTGALSNIKAALSRIGQNFATPIIQNAIPVFNKLRLIVNAINAELKSSGLYSGFEKLSGIVKNIAVNHLSKVEKFFSMSYRFVPNIIDALKIGFTNVLRIFLSIKNAWNNVFTGSGSRNLILISDMFKRLMQVLTPSEAALKGLEKVFTAVFTVLKKLGTAIASVVKTIGPPLITIFMKIVNVGLILVGAIADIITAIFNMVNASKILETVFGAIALVVSKVVDIFKSFKDRLVDNSSGIGSFANKLSTGFKTVATIIGGVLTVAINGIITLFNKLRSINILDSFVNGFKNVAQFILDFIDYLKEIPVVAEFIEILKTAFVMLTDAIVGLTVGFAKLISGIVTGKIVFKDLLNTITGFVDKIKSKISGFLDKYDISNKIQTGLTKIKNGVSTVVKTIVDKIRNLDSSRIVLLAFAGGITLMVYNIAHAMGSLTKLFDTGTSSIKTFTDFITKPSQVIQRIFKPTLAGTLLKIAIAIGLVAASIKTLTNVPIEKLAGVVKQLGILIGMAAGLAVLITVLNKISGSSNTKGLAQFSTNMLMLSGGVAILILALKQIEDLKVEGIWAKVGIIGAIAGGLATIAIVMSKLAPRLTAGSLFMIAFSASIAILVKSLKGLEGLDLSSLKGSWKELAAIFVGLGVLAIGVGKVGIGAVLGLVAFVVAWKLVFSQLDSLQDFIKDIPNKMAAFAERMDAAFTTLSEKIGTSKEEAQKTLIHLATIVGGIIVFLALVGHGLKDFAKSLVIIAAVSVGLILVSKYIADWIESSPRLPEAVNLLISLMGFVGLLMVLSRLANENALAQSRKMFTSLAAVMLAMAVFVKVTAGLTPEEYAQATKALYSSLIIIGIFSTLIALFNSLAKGGAQKGISTFLGIIALFGVLLGSLAVLMALIANTDDFAPLIGAIIVLGILIGYVDSLLVSLGKIRVGKGLTGPVLALFVGLGILAVAIAGAVKLIITNLKEGEMARAWSALGLLMVGLGVIAGVALGIQALMKNKAFNATKTSLANLEEFKKIILLLVGVMAALTIITVILEPIDGGKIIGHLQAVMLAVAELAGLALLLEKFAKNGSQKGMESAIKAIEVMTLCFMGIAAMAVLLEPISGGKIIGHLQAVALVIGELAGLTILLSLFVKNSAGVKAGTAAIFVMTACFAAIGGIAYILEDVDGGKIIGHLQAIALVVGELTGLTILLSLFATNIEGVVAGIAAMAIMTLCFIGIAQMAVQLEEIPGGKILGHLQAVSLVLVELAAIVVLMGVLAEFTTLGLIGVAALISMTAIFMQIGSMAVVLQDIDGGVILGHLSAVALVIAELGLILVALGALVAFTAPALVGVIGIIAICNAMLTLANVLKQLEGMSAGSIAATLSALSLGLLEITGVGMVATVAAIGLLALSVAVEAIGRACNNTGEGVRKFAEGMKELSVIKDELPAISTSVLQFFTSFKEGMVKEITSMGTEVTRQITILTRDIAAGLQQGLLQAAGVAYQSAAAIGVNIVNGFNAGSGGSNANWVSKFKTQMQSQLTNTSAIQSSTKQAWFNVGRQTEMGFRDGAGFHSPLEWLGKFFNQFVSDMKSGESVTSAAANAAMLATGNSLVQGWNSSGAMDIPSQISGVMDQIQGELGGNFNFTGDFDYSSLMNQLFACESDVTDEVARIKSILSQIEGIEYADYAAAERSAKVYKNMANELQDLAQKARATADGTAVWNGKLYKYYELQSLANQKTHAANQFGKEYANICGQIADKEEELANGAKNAGQAVDDFGNSAAGAGGKASKSADEINKFTDSLKSTLESQMNVFDEFKKAEGHTKEELFKNIESQINGMTAWAVNMDKLAERGIDQGLYQKLAEMGPQGAGYMEAFLSMTSEELAKYNDLWATSLVLPDTVSTMLTGSLQKAGSDAITGLYNGVNSGHAQVVDEFGNVATESVDEVKTEWNEHSPSKVFIEIGRNAMEGLRLGMMNSQGNVFQRITFICHQVVALAKSGLQPGTFASISKDAMDGLTSGIDSGSESAIQSALKAASNIVSGLKEGIEKGTNEVVSAATKMIQSVIDAVNKKTESHSPSKLFERMGEYLDEGMAIGIRKGTNMVTNSIEDMADSSIEAMKYTIANIAAQVEDSFEDPVITPILDLSNVKAGARDLNNIFNTNQAAIRAGSFTSDQNGQQIGSSGAVIFNQNNYSPKALSRIDIYRDTRNLFAQAKGALS